MQNLRQPQKLDKGDRQISGRSIVFRPEGVYIYIERAKTAVEKDHKFKEIRRISTLNRLIYVFLPYFEEFFNIYRSFSVLPNVTSPCYITSAVQSYILIGL